MSFVELTGYDLPAPIEHNRVVFKTHLFRCNKNSVGCGGNRIEVNQGLVAIKFVEDVIATTP